MWRTTAHCVSLINTEDNSVLLQIDDLCKDSLIYLKAFHNLIYFKAFH